MRARTVAALLLIAAATTSCLTYQSSEFRFERRGAPGAALAERPWNYEIALRRLESEAGDAPGLASDFSQLMDDFERCRDSVRAGHSGIAPGGWPAACELLVEGGALVFRERGTTAHPDSLGFGELRLVSGDSLMLRLGRGELGATDGRVRTTGDSVFVTWPRDARALRFTALTQPFSPNKASHFAARYRRWQKSH